MSHASRPCSAMLTWYPAARTSAESWARETGSSSATRTEKGLGMQEVEDGTRFAPHEGEPRARQRQIARLSRHFDVPKQRGQGLRAEGGGRRLDDVRGAVDRLRIFTLGCRHERVEALRQGGDERGDDPVDRLLRARLPHRAAERLEVDRQWPRSAGLHGKHTPTLNHGEELMRLKR